MPALLRRSSRLIALLTLAASLAAVPADAAPPKILVQAGDVPMTSKIATALRTLPPITPYSLFIHFDEGAFETNKALVQDHGLTITSEFPSVDAVYAWGTIGEIRGLTREPSITYLEHNRPITLFQDSTVWATRARAAQEAVAGGPYFDPTGGILDGAGVGVAVLDTGIDGSHPDLANRVVNNFKVVCSTPFLINTTTEQCFGPVLFVDLGDTGPTDDNASGHGTHVSGIAVGDGTASTGDYGTGVTPTIKGAYSGIAPGASLYSFSVADATAFLTIAESFQWILDNNATLDVPIKVINNSWGSGPISGEPELPHDPNSIESKLVNRLVESGVTVVFAAANRGGDGASDRTSPECKNPTPGVICVANYHDAGTGSRDNVLSTTSSRGRAGQPLTYPDISAPGTSSEQVAGVLVASGVAAPCRPGSHMTDCALATQAWPGFYSVLSGTSMAAPHVSGAIALLAQAVPNLTPAQIEDVIQDTAHRFTAGGAYEADPQNTGGVTSFDKGAGLLDVKAALDALGVPHAGSAALEDPMISITAPFEGSVFDGSTSILVEGSANDGTASSTPPPTHLIVSGDEGDFEGPGAADITAVRVTETPAGATAGGFFYEVDLRDGSDLPDDLIVTLQVDQTVAGRSSFTRVTYTKTSVSLVAESSLVTAPATAASRAGDTIEFFVPYANLGNPPAGSVGYSVQVESLLGTIVDRAPGISATALADSQARPQFARPYPIQRPDLTVPPVADVTLSVDGGPAQEPLVSGASPAYTWTDTVDVASLADGAHTLTATLTLDGVPVATDVVTFTVARPPKTYEVLITDPAEGATVSRGSVVVSGTAFTDDPSLDRVVTVEVLGPEPVDETPATGVEAWAVTLDFDRQPGDYTIVARFLVDGVEQATHEAGIVVPPIVGTEVSCAPQTIRFWRHEFGTQDPNGFTDIERGLLLDRAVLLSDGLFANGEQLRAALLYTGKPTGVTSAQRQFATLLLNLGAGDLSATMSQQVGVSGAEGLDPSVYATGVVGATVDAARAWIRGRFPDGNLGGATEVADAINNGHGLICG